MGEGISKLIKRPIGRVLVDAGLVTEEKLGKALEEQNQTNKHLGEILVNMGELSRRDLDIVLSLQRELIVPEEAVRLAAGIRKMLGEILVQAGRLTSGQLEQALAEQRRTGEKIGQTLVRLGMATKGEIDTALTIQKSMAAGSAISSPLRLGELLIAAKYLTREQLETALQLQRDTNKKLGEILVESGVVDAKAIAWGVRLQGMLVRAALIAALSLSSLPVAAVAEAGSVSTKIHISAVVLAHAGLNIIKQQNELVVTDADVRRGFVQVPEATVLELKNNTRAGCLLTIEAQGLPYREATVSIMGREIAVGPNGGFVPLPITGKTTVSMQMRIVLAEGTQPGTYAWPFALSVTSL